MIIESVRLLVTLVMTAAGFIVGRALPGWVQSGNLDPDVTVVYGAVLGAGFGYLFGGLMGRMIRKGLDRAPDLVARATGPQLFAGAFGLLAGIVVGAVIALPLIVFLPSVVGWLLGALIVLVLAAFGGRVFAERAHDVLTVGGFRERRAVRGASEEGTAFVIDTSAAIDGRVLELARAKLVSGQLWLPEFVLAELQGVADSGDKNRRRRGRRGLDVLEALRDVPGLDVRLIDESLPEFEEVDAKLLALCDRSGATLVTTDHNLAKIAALRGIDMLNPHAVGEALRPGLGTGDRIELLLERAGTEPGQAVGYLDDGTMVVVEGASEAVGDTLLVEIANSLRTSVGRMLFAKPVT